ncbi:hypothetical protein P389DRAFT_210686 [Cystobasidium minutum MCA 4210]|uniref:uncharacterized protein n=1 Tax=Cystobasidium minutum MCA 4210 TaxID=1397322 RepID=UPI0034CFACBC|eukprot:jgi/Rhomi1/210686/estExt_Genemark1.C_4_t10252
MATLHLPEEVLHWICRTSLEAGVPASILATINSHWHAACYGIIYEHLVLPDDYEQLLHASSVATSTRLSDELTVVKPRAIRKIKAVMRNNNYASSVKAIYIVEATRFLSEPARVRGENDAVKKAPICPANFETPATDAGINPNVEDRFLHLVKKHLFRLQSVTWALRQPPSQLFMTQLNEACAHLSSIDILHASHALKNGYASLCLEDSSPGKVQAAISTSVQPRWDAVSLGGLQLSRLVSLTLQNLSSEGVKLFGSICAGLINCQTLEVWDTLFIDDSLLAGIALGFPNLLTLRIKRMASTKVTNKGIAAIMEHSLKLQELEMFEFGGRLSKKCWEDITTYPRMLRRVKIIYAENCSHAHSWTTDHLLSIASLVEKAEALEAFHVGRLVSNSDTTSSQDERHLPVAMQPRPLPEGFLAVLMKRRGILRSLNLDFWELSYDRLRTVFEILPGFQKLQILLDAPFAKLLGVSSTHLSFSQLQVFSVSITERFQFSTSDKIAGKPRNRSKSVVESCIGIQTSLRARQSSVGGIMPDGPYQEEREAIPAAKDVKKLAKRFPHLSRLEWGGKNGAGIWHITRATNSKDITVHAPLTHSGAGMALGSVDLSGIHTPELGETLANLGIDLKDTSILRLEVPETYLATSITSSSLAASLSSSTESSAGYQSNATVPSSPESPKTRLSPARKFQALSPRPTPTDNVEVAPSIAHQGVAGPRREAPKPPPLAVKKIHRDGWVTRKPASTNKASATPEINKPLQLKRPTGLPATSGKPAALTEENLKQLKKSSQSSRSNNVPGMSSTPEGGEAPHSEKAKQAPGIVDGGFALVS